MRRTLIYFSLFAFVFLGCQDEPEIPAGTVSEAKMAQILTDIHIIEARVGRLGMTSLDSSTIVTEHMKLRIFKKYGVDSSAYNKSYQFYSTNPVFLERIYDTVVKDLETRQNKKNYKGF